SALGASSPVAEFDALERALALEEAAQQARRSFDAAWEPSALALPLASLQQTLRVAREQFFVFAWFSRRRVRAELVPHARNSPPKDGAGLEAAVGALLATKAALDALVPHEQALSKLRGRAERIDVEAARRRLAAAREVHAVLREQDPRVLDAVGARAASLVGSALVAASLRSLEAPLKALEEQRATAARLLALPPESTTLAFRGERERSGRWLAKQSDWDVWSAYCVERELATKLGLEPIARALEQGQLAPRRAEVATRAGALQGWIESRLRREIELATCGGTRVAELRRALHGCMKEYVEGASDAIDCVARDRAKAFFDEPAKEHREAVATLHDLKSRQSMRRTIRRVMGETGPALLALKPVVLASPL
ncbi:MAG: hypothetical protein ACKO4Q_08830, partial [Planctomycetota bacterium]